MKILFMSDVHVEFMADRGVDFFTKTQWPDHDVCVIAGDLCSSGFIDEAISLVCDTFKEVIYTPGNHEYYGGRYFEVKNKLLSINNNNFHLLMNSAVTLNSQRFLGGTMWFKDYGNDKLKMNMNDFHRIAGIDAIYKENAEFYEFIKNNCDDDDIVVTHHLPSYRSVHQRWVGSALNKYFVNDVEPLIMTLHPKIWIHGLIYRPIIVLCV